MDNIETQQAALAATWKTTGDALQAFPRGTMGLTPDATKATPEWQAANRAYRQAFTAYRQFNATNAKALRAARKARGGR